VVRLRMGKDQIAAAVDYYVGQPFGDETGVVTRDMPPTYDSDGNEVMLLGTRPDGARIVYRNPDP